MIRVKLITLNTLAFFKKGSAAFSSTTSSAAATQLAYLNGLEDVLKNSDGVNRPTTFLLDMWGKKILIRYA